MLIPNEIELTEKEEVKTGLVYSFIAPDLIDKSGIAHTVTNTGSIGYYSSFGSMMSRYFDGIDDRIAVTDANDLDITGDITLEALITYGTAHTTNTPMIVNKSFNAATFAGNAYGMYIDKSTSSLGICLNGVKKENVVAFTVGKVHHCVVTHSGGACNFYVDGKKYTATAGSTLTRTSAQNLILGAIRYNTTNGFLYSGSIHAVRIYDIELLHTQVNQNFVQLKDLAGYYE